MQRSFYLPFSYLHNPGSYSRRRICDYVRKIALSRREVAMSVEYEADLGSTRKKKKEGIPSHASSLT